MNDDKFKPISSLYGYRIITRDSKPEEPVGKIDGFYFDDQDWTVRYAVVDTGAWMPGEKVLVRPEHFDEVDDERFEFRIKLSREDLRKSAGSQSDKPDTSENERRDGLIVNDPHLWSTRQVIGYHLQAIDGLVGVVSDFMVNDPSWAIRYVVVETQQEHEKKVLISPYWVDGFNWTDSKILVKIPRDEIKHSPEFMLPRSA